MITILVYPRHIQSMCKQNNNDTYVNFLWGFNIHVPWSGIVHFVAVVRRHPLVPLMITSSSGNIFCVIGPLWSPPWTNGWVNNREAGDLRHHRAHFNVIVMSCKIINQTNIGFEPWLTNHSHIKLWDGKYQVYWKMMLVLEGIFKNDIFCTNYFFALMFSFCIDGPLLDESPVTGGLPYKAPVMWSFHILCC